MHPLLAELYDNCAGRVDYLPWTYEQQAAVMVFSLAHDCQLTEYHDDNTMTSRDPVVDAALRLLSDTSQPGRRVVAACALALDRMLDHHAVAGRYLARRERHLRRLADDTAFFYQHVDQFLADLNPPLAGSA